MNRNVHWAHRESLTVQNNKKRVTFSSEKLSTYLLSRVQVHLNTEYKAFDVCPLHKMSLNVVVSSLNRRNKAEARSQRG